ncbi:MAG: Fe-S protein assembly co-chaperone HscB, partial [Chitinophagaceae bacterium]
MSLRLRNIHLHCAGVSATLLSEGILPSLINPILSMRKPLGGAIYIFPSIVASLHLHMNYFELFGFEVAPKVDKSLVAKKYFALQRDHHPDFFTQAHEDEQANSLEQSSHINKAFAIFQDADKTLEYFLQEQGIIQTDEKYTLPPDFLMEMMELNETLDEKDGVTLAAEMAAIEQPM